MNSFNLTSLHDLYTMTFTGSSNCKKEWQNTVIYGKCFGQIQFRQEILWENWSDLWCMARENLSHFFIGFFKRRNGILLPKLFWPTVRKNCSSDWEKLLKFEAEICKKSEITRTIYSDSERSKQFLVADLRLLMHTIVFYPFFNFQVSNPAQKHLL